MSKDRILYCSDCPLISSLVEESINNAFKNRRHRKGFYRPLKGISKKVLEKCGDPKCPILVKIEGKLREPNLR